MKRVSDINHPFYKPLWRRVALVGVTGVWACYENFVVKDPMWMVLTAGVFIYGAWVFLIKWTGDETPADEPSLPTEPVEAAPADDEPAVETDAGRPDDERRD